MAQNSAAKRALDLGLALPVFIITLPVMALLAALIALSLGRPVLFSQRRPGLKGKIFVIYKFRTMREAYDQHGQPLPDAERLNWLGKFIRSTSLDELPSLWNVIKGELSLVGPRPLLERYLPLYNEQQMRRHDVKPGLTGWAQINGRNQQSWDQRFALDLWYVDHWSLWLDLKIIMKTVFKVLQRSGIQQEGRATIDEFRGF